jgi:hypothetical protein
MKKKSLSVLVSHYLSSTLLAQLHLFAVLNESSIGSNGTANKVTAEGRYTRGAHFTLL